MILIVSSRYVVESLNLDIKGILNLGCKRSSSDLLKSWIRRDTIFENRNQFDGIFFQIEYNSGNGNDFLPN